MTETVAFVPVQNAGRSQMAAALARREVETRGLERDTGIVTGGTDPADEVHLVVVEAMAETGLDLSNRKPREIGPGELADADLVVTMGCEAGEVCPAGFEGENVDWDLEDPEGKDVEEAGEIRREVEERVEELFDDIGEETP